MPEEPQELSPEAKHDDPVPATVEPEEPIDTDPLPPPLADPAPLITFTLPPASDAEP
jgi:hypothetical protein